MRRLLLILAAFAVVPASASAAEFYGAPAGTGDAACTAAAPCSLTRALALAGPADQVILLGGDYAVCPGGLTIAGDNVRGRPGLARPVLTGASGCAAVTLTGGSTLVGVDVSGGAPALTLLAGTTAHGVRIKGPTLLQGAARLESSLASEGPIELRSGALVEHVTSGSVIRATTEGKSTVRNTLALGGLATTAPASMDAVVTYSSSTSGSITRFGTVGQPALAPDGFHLLPGPGVDEAEPSSPVFGGDVDDGARSFGAKPDVGADERGTALPTIVSVFPSATGSTTAVVRARVSPNGVPTQLAVQLDGRAETAPVDLGDGFAIRDVDVSITGLAASSDYAGQIRANTVVDRFAFRTLAPATGQFSANPNGFQQLGGLPPGISARDLANLLDAAKGKRTAAVVVSKSARLAKRLQVRCPATASKRCALAVRLVTRGKKPVTLATGSGTVLPGKLASLKLKATAAGRKALRRARSVKVTAIVSYVDALKTKPPVARAALTLRR